MVIYLVLHFDGMNISENDKETISYENQINTMEDVFLFLSIPVVASSIFDNVLIIIVVARDKTITTNIVF